MTTLMTADDLCGKVPMVTGEFLVDESTSGMGDNTFEWEKGKKAWYQFGRFVGANKTGELGDALLTGFPGKKK